MVVCLHRLQNSGKRINTVSALMCVPELHPHFGHLMLIIAKPLFIFLPCICIGYDIIVPLLWLLVNTKITTKVTFYIFNKDNYCGLFIVIHRY